MSNARDATAKAVATARSVLTISAATVAVQVKPNVGFATARGRSRQDENLRS